MGGGPTVEIRDRNHDGRGRGSTDGRVALVSQAHPGEEVVLRVDRTTAGTTQGRVAELVRADPSRIAHTCTHEFVCTGCPLLAVADAEELIFKRDRVVRAAAAADIGAERVAPVLRPSGLFHYRHYAKQVFALDGERTVLGSYVTGTHEVVDNCGCPVLTPALAALLDAVAAAGSGLAVHGSGRAGLRYAVARQSAATGEQLLVLVTSGDPAPTVALGEGLLQSRRRLVGVTVMVNAEEGNALLAGEVVRRLGARFIEEELLGFRHRIGARSFFQINPTAASSLFAAALVGAGEGDVCVDAYAGVGALSLPLCQRFGRVIAVESSVEATGLLASAAGHSEVDNLEVVVGRVEEALPALLEREHPQVAVFDPPRRGIGAEVADMVAASSVIRVVLLTCGLGALAADVRALERGGFAVEAITPVDQFPRTGHVECVTVLARDGRQGQS